MAHQRILTKKSTGRNREENWTELGMAGVAMVTRWKRQEHDLPGISNFSQDKSEREQLHTSQMEN
jgi:hypothetical protein